MPSCAGLRAPVVAQIRHSMSARFLPLKKRALRDAQRGPERLLSGSCLSFKLGHGWRRFCQSRV
ncbi:hypothetical protein BQ8482_110955 [Mesorhizobium delmotii]|uniref:Uncharacterized protein n=1 Tax=Mesorhizobium delmotii TaxID=1631247 RepID=A0A2P9AD48_9HYPH|nr:hypothetical protein BQ8482_110955 [Mesorhizobium delmotii]